MGWEVLLVLGIGATAIVLLAAAASRWGAAAVWPAAVWRVATLSLFVLMSFELTGLGQAVVQLCRQRVGEQGVGGAPAQQSRSIPTRSASEGPSLALRVSAMDLQARPSTTEVMATRASVEDDTTVDAGQTASASPIEPVNDTKPMPAAGGIDVETLPAAPAGSWPLAVVWLTGAVTVLAWLVGGRVAAGFFRRQCARYTDETVLAQLARLKSAFGLRRTIAVLTSPRIAAPVVLGGGRPALVLPPGFTRDFDVRQREAVLAHELAHLVSRDAAWQAAALVLCALLWWHPLVWWLRGQLRAANEARADEASLLLPDGPRILAEALVLLGQRLAGLSPRFGLSLGGGRFRSGLGRRVQRLLALPRRSWRAPRRTRLAFIHFSLPVLVALAAIVGTAWVPFQVPLMQGETTMSVVSNSWRCSLAATALWTMLGAAPAPAAADDQPAKAAPAAVDRQQAEQQLRSIVEKVAQLENDGKHDEAEKLKQQAHEIMAKIHDASGRTPSSQPAVSGPEAEKIRARLKEIGQMVGELEKEGKHDEVERLKHEAMALYSKLNPRAAASAGGPEREKLYQQMRGLREKIEKAKQEGKPEDVQRLMQEAEALRAKLSPQGGDRSRQPQPAGDREARMQRLRMAAENLKAAGFDSEAQHVAQMIERLQADGGRENVSREQAVRSSGDRSASTSTSREGRGDRASSERGDNSARTSTSREDRGGRAPSDRGDSSARSSTSRDTRGAGANSDAGARGRGTPDQPNAAAAVQELRSQVEQMRRELRELREEIKRSRGDSSR